ncbi:MAG: hypothetical protein HY805_01755 [Nitrospirae bacterium]|nr:hypothetical protein [Nitrospirota bacterium]
MTVFIDTSAWVAITDRNDQYAKEAGQWKLLEKYSDKDFSFTDCTSFALMERLKIKTAFTFDAHFTQYGFNQIP